MIQNLKSVLIGFNQEERARPSALHYGFSLARQADAHVSIAALSPELTVTHAFISEVATTLVEEENRRLKGIASELAEQARQDGQAQGVSCTAEAIHRSYPVLATEFAKRARVHDLTIFDAHPDALSFNRGVIEETLFNSGRPLILVPPSFDTFKISTAIIAWDGSAKAAKAVADALPLLKMTQKVEIVCISREKDLSASVPGAELAPNPTRHEIDCTVTELTAHNGDAGEALRSHASHIRADLIVMGAFVHSRLRQFVLGGVTHTMLNNSPVPVLLSY
ncbi:universal stress protein [Microvirga terrestris]|uniref:Universal stress protein n=1 Tax=Microvirga terrestris TaxID=2791024 RepID=A0ABS0HUX4_9HYPH|nr:universal stress protein [Microvirga terrestris]MBF9196955.1 universal stress protein [Microvirga terrestris]